MSEAATKQESIIIQAKKGDVIDIKEKAPNLIKLHVGAGWDMAESGKSIDCDLFAIVLDGNNKPLDGKAGLIYYGNLSHASGAIEHQGDNLTGEGDGDDEVITVNLDTVPDNASAIRFGITIYNAADKGQNFAGIENEFIRLVDASTGQELVHYNEDFGDVTTFIAADVRRSGEGWEFIALGEPATGELSDYVNSL